MRYRAVSSCGGGNVDFRFLTVTECLYSFLHNFIKITYNYHEIFIKNAFYLQNGDYSVTSAHCFCLISNNLYANNTLSPLINIVSSESLIVYFPRVMHIL